MIRNAFVIAGVLAVVTLAPGYPASAQTITFGNSPVGALPEAPSELIPPETA